MALKPVSQGLNFLYQVLSLFSAKSIPIPCKLYEQVLAIDDLLSSDSSGLVNSLLDFAVNSGQVDFSVETSNENLSKILNSWLNNLNSSLRGQIPTGVDALAKQYYIERYKKSSFLILRTVWEQVDNFYLPTKLWFVQGADIKIFEDQNETREIGKEVYQLKVAKDKYMALPASGDERIFVQKPYDTWSCTYPTPFLFRRGIYYNAKFLQILTEKSANVVSKAIEYLMLLKKGDANLVKLNNPDYTYSEDDLKTIKKDFQKLVDDQSVNNGSPTYTTNFDTELDHLIPDYKKILDAGLSSPIERRILAGMGFIEVVEGITTTRKDSIINPRVFMSEVESAVADFSHLMQEVLLTAIDLNKSLHKKYANTDLLQVRHSPIKTFLTENAKELFRGLYDRGVLSKRTMVELGADIDFDVEVERRTQEKKDGLEQKMFPPVTQNIVANTPSAPGGNNPKATPDKQGPEAKNFKQAGEELF